MSERLNNKSSLKEVRRTLRNNATFEENRLWQYLKNSQLNGKKFRRQHSFGNIIMDFYCPSEKLAIELDGAPHFTQEGKILDQERDQILASYGIQVLRFTNREIAVDVENVLEKIALSFKNKL